MRREVPPLGTKGRLHPVILGKVERPRGQGALKAVSRSAQHGPRLERPLRLANPKAEQQQNGA